MGEEEPKKLKWDVSIAPGIPFMMSLVLPIVTQKIYPASQLKYFDELITNKLLISLKLPNNISPYVSKSLILRGMFGSLLWIIGFKFMLGANILDEEPGVTKLAKKGVFKFTRNPIYLGSIFAMIGTSIYLDNGSLGIFTILYTLWLNYIIIPKEEQGLIEYFGDDYKEYMKETKKWGFI